jgi:hypothetical protein
MFAPFELSASQAFDKERFKRAITESRDPEELRKIATTLLEGWYTQRAATQWIMKQALQAGPKSAKVAPEDIPTP